MIALHNNGTAVLYITRIGLLMLVYKLLGLLKDSLPTAAKPTYSPIVRANSVPSCHFLEFYGVYMARDKC